MRSHFSLCFPLPETSNNVSSHLAYKKMIKDPAPIVEVLRPILANTALLYLKTHQYHHNVKGSNFYASHLVFNDQYQALFEAIDIIGERIEKLFGTVPVTSEYFDLGDIGDAVIGAPELDIYKDLARDNFELANQCIKAAIVAQDLDDGATVNLLGDRQEQHEDFVWRLTSMLPDSDRDNFIDELQASVETESEDEAPTEKRLRIKA